MVRLLSSPGSVESSPRTLSGCFELSVFPLLSHKIIYTRLFFCYLPLREGPASTVQLMP
jgi:hypothetical protein